LFTQILSGLYHKSFKKGNEPIASENEHGGLSWHLNNGEEWSYENINLHLLKWLAGEAWRRNMLQHSKAEEIKNSMPYDKIRVHKDTTHMNLRGNYYDYSNGFESREVVLDYEYGIRTEELFKGEIVFRDRGDYNYELLQYIEGDWDYHSFAERLFRDWDSFFNPTSEYFAFDRANLWRIVGENPYLTGKKHIYIDGQKTLLRVDHTKDDNQYILFANDKPEKSSSGSNFWDGRGVGRNKLIFNGVNLHERFFNDLTDSSSDSDDNIVGSGSDDFIELKDGYVDVFYAEYGNDVVFGNEGQDLIYGNQGSDIIYGNQDHDVIYGGKDSDKIYGNLDDDILFGNLGDDYIYGGENNDKLYGGKGNDLLDGGNGDDLLWGNKGADTFLCTKGFDVIKDFWGLDGDKISVASVASAVISQKDGSTLITSGDGQLLLEGFARQFFDESQYLI